MNDDNQFNPHILRMIAGSLRASDEGRIAGGRYLPDDPPCVPMALFREQVVNGLHAMGFKELSLLERHNVTAATGLPRVFCYVGCEAPDGNKWCFQMNLTSTQKTIDIKDYIATRALAWDGTTPIEYAVHQMTGTE